MAGRLLTGSGVVFTLGTGDIWERAGGTGLSLGATSVVAVVAAIDVVAVVVVVVVAAMLIATVEGVGTFETSPPLPPPKPRSSSSSCNGLMSLYAPGPIYMRPSGWSQKGLPPSSISEMAFEGARSLREEVCFGCDSPKVLLLLICCWLTSFSSGGRSGGPEVSSTNSGNSSPGFGKVNWIRPVGL
jgi:hypothetical protein